MERRLPTRRALSRASLLAGVLLLAACQAPRRPEAPASSPPPAERAPTPAVPPATSPPPPPKRIVSRAPTDAGPPAPVRGADLFARLRRGFADPPCLQDRVVQRWERLYGRASTRFRAGLEPALPLLQLVLDELERYHLPAEYALLPIVESWYRPDAGSPRSAYGMWQFTSATARNFGLQVRPGLDERLDALAATRAAARYLAVLQNQFGDWKLANMAYNAGDYRLRRALARAPEDQREVSAAHHRPPGLSMITYEHVAKMQALACLFAEPQRFGLRLPDEVEVIRLRAVPVPAGGATLAQLAKRSGAPLSLLDRLNPGLRRAAPAGARLLLPAPAAERLAQAASGALRGGVGAPGPATRLPAEGRPREHRVVAGDTLGTIARRYGVQLADLLRWNGLDVRAPIHPGQRVRLEP